MKYFNLAALLSQLNTANPMARLKKTITKEVTGTSKNNPPPPPAGDGSNPPLAEQERPRAMSMM